MHPALSVILFTSASGGGYAMLALLGLFGAGGGLSADPLSGWVAFAWSLGMVTFGLVSSTLHLSHPERAWRAFSQWRSSWLSREGVLAVFTFVPAGLYAIGWLFLGQIWQWVGLLLSLGAFATVCATAMIYASLKPIRAWNNLWTLPGYLAMGLSSGALWFTLWTEVMPAVETPAYDFAGIGLLLAAAIKLGYWHFLDAGAHAATAESATGLGAFGKVRMLTAPHTEENYLLKEMGFRIARKHAQKLRRIALIAGFLLPLAAVVAAALFTPHVVDIVLLAVAIVLNAIGTVTERWLFFAEAKHTVMLYYGAERA
ncbi:MAG TPA: DmsC/YnfH family molybdoenzyme membrane anchor subunit [Dongiaceae bacterium]